MEIEIYSIPLSAPKEKIAELRELLIDDKNLNMVIKEYSLKLKVDNVETWEVDKNLIIAETGYKVALYVNDEQVLAMAQQIVEQLGPEAAAMLAEAIMQMLQGAPQEAPVYARKGGKLVKVK